MNRGREVTVTPVEFGFPIGDVGGFHTSALGRLEDWEDWQEEGQ